MHRNAKRGFTLVEIIGVMIIISILTIAAGYTATKAVQRSRIDATAADLQVFASDMEAVLEDIGVVELDPSDSLELRKSKINEYLSIIEQDYLHATFARETLVVSDSGFKVSTYELIDPWNSKYTLIYNTDAAKGTPGTCIFASPGPNLNLEDTGYSSGDFQDDILVIVTPKH